MCDGNLCLCTPRCVGWGLFLLQNLWESEPLELSGKSPHRLNVSTLGNKKESIDQPLGTFPRQVFFLVEKRILQHGGIIQASHAMWASLLQSHQYSQSHRGWT